jgi:HEAT repeat protein
MTHKLINAILERPWLRIGLAVGLLVAGLAPIGVPIASDNSWRVVQTGPEIAALDTAQAFMYRTESNTDGSTRVQRSDDGSATWHDVAAIPFEVLQLVAVAGDEEVAYARTPSSIWVSEDGGSSWSRTAPLPSRPAALAVAGASTGTVYVGTESMGLLRSNSRGASWQTFANSAFPTAGAAPLGVTALAINPEDEQIVYAAVGFWLGTTHVRFDPLGLFASVDGGSHWFQMSRAALGSPSVEKIEPVAGQPLTVMALDAAGEQRIELGLNKTLTVALDDADPGTRVAAARAIGLAGDGTALPVLLDHLRQDPDVLAGDQIGWAIGRLDDRSAVSPLLDILRSEDEALQSRAAYALGLLEAEEAVPLLAETLERGNAMAQRRAAEALGAIGTPKAIVALEAPLSTPEMTSARNAAMVGLEIAGERATGALAQSLTDQNPALRTNAAEMLGWLKASGATPQLGQALSDADAAVRAQAAWALGEIGTTEAREALASALPGETDAVVRQASQEALVGLATPSSTSASRGPAWMTGLLGMLATIPVGKWAFMTLATGVAVFLLLAGSRKGQTRAV